MNRPREHRKKDQWKNIPWKRRYEISEQIEAMNESNEKLILKLAFIDNMSTTDIGYYCEDHNILSRNHKPYSRRRIQQIIAENIPDYNAYQKHTQRSKERATHAKIRDSKQRTFCGICGCTEKLELHHMIPVFLGGTDSECNLIWLCNKCHEYVTNYQREQFKDIWYRRDENEHP